MENQRIDQFADTERSLFKKVSPFVQSIMVASAYAQALEMNAAHDRAELENMDFLHGEALAENDRFDRLAARHYVFWMGTAANDRAAWLAQDHADALAQDAINNAWEKVNQ